MPIATLLPAHLSASLWCIVASKMKRFYEEQKEIENAGEILNYGGNLLLLLLLIHAGLVY
jgi:hypothetical protein